jgi:hypothetical protein
MTMCADGRAAVYRLPPGLPGVVFLAVLFYSTRSFGVRSARTSGAGCNGVPLRASPGCRPTCASRVCRRSRPSAGRQWARCR